MKHNDDGRTVDLSEARCVPASDPLTAALCSTAGIPLPTRPSVAPPEREQEPRVEWAHGPLQAVGRVGGFAHRLSVFQCRTRVQWAVEFAVDGYEASGAIPGTVDDAKALAEAVFRLLHAAWLRSREVKS